MKLDELVADGTVSRYDDYSTDSRVHFAVTVPNLPTMSDASIEKHLAITSTMNVNNMHFFDSRGKIVKYGNVNEIITEFFAVRLDFYHKRKAFLQRQLEEEHKKLANQLRFVRAVMSKEIDISNRKKGDILIELRSKGFDRFSGNESAIDQAALLLIAFFLLSRACL